MPTLQDPWKDTPVLTERIASALARLATIQRSLRWQAAAAEGINPAQADVLELLAARAESAGGLRLSTVARQLGVTPASASDTVAALVAKNLTRKAPALDDARAISLKLTRTGVKMAERIAQASDLIGQSAAQLAPEGQAGLYRQLLAMVFLLQQDERFGDLRACVSCKYFGAHEHQSTSFPHHCHLINIPLSESLLRLDCNEHEAATERKSQLKWLSLVQEKA